MKAAVLHYDMSTLDDGGRMTAVVMRSDPVTLRGYTIEMHDVRPRISLDLGVRDELISMGVLEVTQGEGTNRYYRFTVDNGEWTFVGDGSIDELYRLNLRMPD